MIRYNSNVTTRTIILLSVTILFSGCFEQGFSIKSLTPSTERVPAAVPAPATGTTTQTAITFRNLQPALAVRGASCLMCHAQVSANILSDFGNGNSYFFDKDKGGAGFYSDWYGGSISDGSSSWGTAIIHGSAFVPKASLDHTFPLVGVQDPKNLKTSMSLAEVVQSPRYNSSGAVVQPGMSTGVSPVTGSNAVIEKKTVYIGAPTEAEIIALAPEVTAAGFKSIAVTGITPDPNLPLSGLQVISGSAGSYVTNSATEPFVCAGDVMVRGTLFLNTLNVKTDDNGCRLYVSGSVFVQGPIAYSGSNLTSANLQITSAKMIAMGFNVNSLRDRLGLQGGRAFILNYYTTRNPISPQIRHESYSAEASMISNLADAGADSSSTAANAFSGLLLNAPEVHSRYVGNFKGAVVAEIAMFRLGEFVFTFDSLFQKVPILPALKSDILSFTD